MFSTYRFCSRGYYKLLSTVRHKLTLLKTNERVGPCFSILTVDLGKDCLL